MTARINSTYLTELFRYLQIDGLARTKTVPEWILENRRYVVRYLRGLYEAEGSLSHHEPTCTHKLSFSNMNPTMLENVYNLMSGLGFHPHRDAKRVQLSRKEEVHQAVELLQFRKY